LDSADPVFDADSSGLTEYAGPGAQENMTGVQHVVAINRVPDESQIVAIFRTQKGFKSR
jgi:hypothetical protein